MTFKKMEYTVALENLENLKRIVEEFAYKIKLDTSNNFDEYLGFDGKIVYIIKIYRPYPNGKVTLIIFRIGNKEIIGKEDSDIEIHLKRLNLIEG